MEQSETEDPDVMALRITDLTRPLVGRALSNEESKLVHGAAAREAHRLWWQAPDNPEEPRILEIIRLACGGGGERAIACDLTRRVLNSWVRRSRYREVVRWGRLVLDAFEEPVVLTRVAEAEKTLGQTEAARVHLKHSLELQQGDDSWARSHALFEQAGLVRQQGDVAEAGRVLGEALAIAVRLGDEQGARRRRCTRWQMCESSRKMWPGRLSCMGSRWR